MEVKLVLKEFRQRRKLLENLRENMAKPRLKGMWNFLQSQTETRDIVRKNPTVEHLIARAAPGTPLQAEDLQEVVGVGLYILKECNYTDKHITEIIHGLGIGSRDPKPTRQSYVDDAMFGYINPALDFIESELEKLVGMEEKDKFGKNTTEKTPLKVLEETAAELELKAIQEGSAKLSRKDSDESTIEEASIGAYSISDQATDVDSLGFEPYTTAIAEFLGHEQTRPPITMSIEGEWGSGKSSFMLQLKKKLVSKGGLIVTFSPWRHEEEESVWAAFVLTFSEQLAEELGFFNSIKSYYKLLWERFNWREGWPELIKFAIKCFAYFIILIGVIIVLWAGWIPYIEDVSRKVFVSIFGAAAVIWQVLKKSSEVIGNPFKHDLKKYIQTPDYTSRIPFIEKFHKDFKKIVETYAGDKRVYVFIDDLDRCEVPKATDLMQAINLMISDEPQLVFIVGMDRQKIAAGLAVKHEKLLPYITSQRTDTNHSIGLEYGYSFIEKFIQLPFKIPRPTESDIENLMDKISETHQVEKVESPSGKQIDGTAEPVGAKQNIEEGLEEEKVREQRRETLRLKLAGDSPKIREIVLMVAPVFDYNPRRVKQFINLFRLRVYIASETGLFDILESETQFNRLTLPQLGKFVAITMGWPPLIADLSQDNDLLKKLVRTSEKDIEKESEYVQRWFKDERLRSLVEYVPDKKRDKGEDLEWTQYSLLYVDVKKLLEISPHVTTGEDVLQQDLETTQEKYKAFYAELLDSIKEKRPEITREKASSNYYLSLPIGHPGIHLEWAFHGRPRSWFEVGLHFEKPSMEKNRKLHDHFLDIKKELVRNLGGLELTFQCPWGTRWARIYASKQGAEMTDELKDWAVKTALKFYDVFKPRLDEFIRSKTDGWGAIDKEREITSIERASQMEKVAEEEAIDEELVEKLKMPVQELQLSRRARNCFESIKLETVGQLVKLTEADLLKIRSFGKASLREVKRELAEIGLSLGMTDVSD